MNQAAEQIVKKILSLIEYPGDREKYTKEFLETCTKESFADSVQSLSPQMKEELLQKLAGEVAPEKQKEILSEYISPEVYMKIFNQQVLQTLQAFIQELLPDMTLVQKNELQRYFAELQQPALGNTSSF